MNNRFEDITYAVSNNVALVTLNRPGKLNAFTREMLDGWAKSLTAAQADDSVHVIIVTGAGRAFCSGGDVGRMREGGPSALDGKNGLWEGVHRVPNAGHSCGFISPCMIWPLQHSVGSSAV